MSLQVKSEKVIKRTASEVFRAIKEGRLFLNCGCNTDMKIDFRVGGKYHVDYKRMKFSQFGEFVEIIQDKKIVFTWCQVFAADQTPDSQVSIELIAEGSNTKMVLVHSGFKTQEATDNHQKGWESILPDFSEEIQSGRLRMVRLFKAPIEEIFESCKNPNSFFALKGKILESVPNQKITLSWSEGKVTLLFNQKDAQTTRMELIHDGLNAANNPIAHRKDWEAVTDKMNGMLK